MKNNAYKKIRQIVSLFTFSILSIGFVIGCSEPEDMEDIKPDMPVMTKAVCEEYLSIDNFADLVAEAEATGTCLDISSQEREILFKVFDRIFDNLASVDGKPDFSSISAESLNMDDDLFNITLDALRPYITGEKIIGENVQEVKNTNDKLLRIPRMKSKSESGSDLGDGWYMGGGGSTGGGNEGGGIGFGGGGYIPPTEIWSNAEIEEYIMTISKTAMYQIICIAGEFSDFEKACFTQYWYAKGDMVISENDWSGIKYAAQNALLKENWQVFKDSIEQHSIQNVHILINNQNDTIKYYEYVISFYPYPDYNYALGSATVIFTEDGEAVGLYDIYDFNSGPKRIDIHNKITATMEQLGRIFEAESYEIRYGITFR